MSGPHDLFARFTFGHPERAAAELSAVLPPEVVARVDWSTLHHESASVVDPELRERQSDLLFSARLHGGQPPLLYFLLEHQSSVDRWMTFRMLRYVVRQLEHWRQQHLDSEALPVIIPVVMYHGPEGGWTAPRRMEELFHLPSEARERWQVLVPRFEYLVDDLTAEREEVLRARPGPPLVRMAWLLLRSGRSEKLAGLLEGWRPLLAEVLASPEGHEHLRAIVHYLLRVGVEAAHGPLRRVLNSVAGEQRAEELMKTMGEVLIEQGHAKGLAEGVAKGRTEGLAEGLAEGQAKGRAEGVLRILAARGIAVDETARTFILSCTDLNTLDQWLDRALSATSLSDLMMNG
jgi:predicted transposase YdaD